MDVYGRHISIVDGLFETNLKLRGPHLGPCFILLKPFETAVLYPTRQIVFDTKPMAMSVSDNSSFNAFTSHIKIKGLSDRRVPLIIWSFPKKMGAPKSSKNGPFSIETCGDLGVHHFRNLHLSSPVGLGVQRRHQGATGRELRPRRHGVIQWHRGSLRWDHCQSIS